jgi:subtilisin family serine protease
MITVTALTRGGGKPPWANYGSKTVDIGAPGVTIWSTFPFDGYEAYSGTSQAAPFVTGAAALYESAHPGASAAEIRNAILSTAKPTKSLQGLVATNGRLNIGAAVK